MLRTSSRPNRLFLGVAVSVAATFVALACGPGDRPAPESGTCVPTETAKCTPPLVAGEGPGAGGGGAPGESSGGVGTGADDGGATPAPGNSDAGAVDLGVDFPDLGEIFRPPMGDGGGTVVP